FTAEPAGETAAECARPRCTHGSSIPTGLCPPAQGSSFLATLGFVAESLQDSSSAPGPKVPYKMRRPRARQAPTVMAGPHFPGLGCAATLLRPGTGALLPGRLSRGLLSNYLRRCNARRRQ